jgi:hypothetical protein
MFQHGGRPERLSIQHWTVSAKQVSFEPVLNNANVGLDVERTLSTRNISRRTTTGHCIATDL